MKTTENTKTKDQKQLKTGQIIWILIAIVVIAIYFFGLTVPLLGPDEPRYTQIAREMFERGDWVTPKLGGFDWFEKPALLYWLQIVSFKLFGVSEFAARSGSAIFGLGTIFSLWVLGRNYPQINTDEHGFENNRRSNEFANWLAVIAGSSIGLIAFSRGASFDIIVTFPITASLVGFFLFDQSDGRNRSTVYLSLFTFYFFIGVSLIAKGLIGIVFPFAIVAFYFLLSWKLPTRTFILSLFWGTILSLLIAATWYLPMYLENGWKFIDEFIIQHHFQRYASNKYQHPQPFWFFWVVLPLMTIPWLPFFLASIWRFFKNVFQQLRTGNKPVLRRLFLFTTSPLLLFSFAWMLVPLVFFSISGSKLPGYILPSLPPALIFTAVFVYEFVQKSKRRETSLKVLAFLTFAIVAIAVRFFLPQFAEKDSVKSLFATANEQGYTSETVVNLHTISHNAEFYAAGRLVRSEDGKLRKFLGLAEVEEQMKMENSKTILVLVPVEYLHELKDSPEIDSNVLQQNGDLAIVLVSRK
jgi:4-amino-4-deoxy-L-arabinose transferase-like glycosyltransferase